MREYSYNMGIAMGIVPRAELNFGLGYVDLFDKEFGGPYHGHGWNDLEIGAKLLLFESEEHAFAFSYAPSVTIPSGRESRAGRLGPGENSTLVSQRLIASKDLGRWNANMDSGYALPAGNRQGNRGTWDTNLAVGYQLLAWLQPAVELHYTHNFIAGEGDVDLFAMTCGVIMPVHERLRIDAGVKQALAGANADQTTQAQLVATLYL